MWMRLVIGLAIGLAIGLGVAGSTQVHAAVTVDQVEAEGMRALGLADLESVLEVGAGYPYDAADARHTAENLAELYQFRGYPEVKVQAVWNGKGKLTFKVSEGRPVRIAEVRIIPEIPETDEARRFWARTQPRLLALLNLSEGDVFDQEKASAIARALQAALLDENYIGSAVNEVRVDRVDRADGPGVSSWVRLQIRLEPGERVTFGFRGNEYFSRNELLLQITEQRALGLGKNYLETLRSRLLDLYWAAGFAQATIQAFPQESQGRHVTWVISEGPRARIRGIDFDGNVAYTDAELKPLFLDGVPKMLGYGIYVQSEVNKSAEFLIQKLKARGYLSARLLSLQTLWNAAHSQADLMIYLSEGEQTRVGEVQVTEVKGGLIPGPQNLSALLGVKSGEPLNIFAFSEGVQTLKRWYRNHGYLDAAVLREGTSGEAPDAIVRYRDETRIADIRLEVQAGAQYRLSSILVEGLQKTRDFVVLREVDLTPGQVLTEDSLAEAESRLRKLGLFSSVQVRLAEDPAKSEGRIVIFAVQEGTPGLLAGGLGYRNDLGVRAFATTSYGNLFGRNHTVSFTTTVNRRLEERRVPVEYQAQLGYVWPWFGLGDLSFRPNLTFQRIQYVNFDAASLAVAATWDKRLLKSINLVGALNYSLERTDQKAEDLSSIDNQTLTIGAVTPSLRLDLRDNPLAPTRGFYGSLSYEIADPLLLSQTDPFPVGFTRLLFRSDYTWNVWRDVSWYFSFRSGLE